MTPPYPAAPAAEPVTKAGKALAARAKREAFGNWEGIARFEIPAIEAEARSLGDRAAEGRGDPRDTREYLRANLFDGDESGELRVRVDRHLTELTEVVDELIAQRRPGAGTADALWTAIVRTGMESPGAYIGRRDKLRSLIDSVLTGSAAPAESSPDGGALDVEAAKKALTPFREATGGAYWIEDADVPIFVERLRAAGTSESPGALSPLQREVEPPPPCSRCQRPISQLTGIYRCASCHALFDYGCILQHFGWPINGQPHTAEPPGARAAARIIGADEPWPLWDVLRTLRDATTHLLDAHACDTAGYESFGHARDAIAHYLEVIRPLRGAATGAAEPVAPDVNGSIQPKPIPLTPSTAGTAEPVAETGR